jgi:hypothetical protein
VEFSLIVFLFMSALIIGLGKGGLGGAFVGVLTPIASIFMPVSEVIAYLVPLLIVGDWFALRSFWGRWDGPQLKLLLPTGCVTVLIGTYFLTNLPNQTLRVILGILTLAVGVYKLAESRLQQMKYTPRWSHGWIAGAISGMGSGLASAGGPPLTAYLLLIRSPPVVYIATSAVFFAMMNLVRMPALVATGLLGKEDLLKVIWFFPVVWIGNEMGRYLVERINPHIFTQAMVITLIVAGIVLITQ